MEPSPAYIKELITYAKTLVGVPYERGAQEETTKSFDCSSFIRHIFKHVGIELPRSSILQAADLQGKTFFLQEESNFAYCPGDLIFMRGDRGYYYDELFENKKIYIGHVAMYIGNGDIINSRKSAGGVIIEKLEELTQNPNYRPVLIKRLISS